LYVSSWLNDLQITADIIESADLAASTSEHSKSIPPLVWTITGCHWLSISSFSVKNLTKNVHYYKASEKLGKFSALLACFNFFTFKTKKW
jgi:hypothetical protein